MERRNAALGLMMILCVCGERVILILQRTEVEPNLLATVLLRVAVVVVRIVNLIEESIIHEGNRLAFVDAERFPLVFGEDRIGEVEAGLHHLVMVGRETVSFRFPTVELIVFLHAAIAVVMAFGTVDCLAVADVRENDGLIDIDSLAAMCADVRIHTHVFHPPVNLSLNLMSLYYHIYATLSRKPALK